MTISYPHFAPSVQYIPGPILVIGASGFIGANILHTLLCLRRDVFGTIFSGDSWRLNDIPAQHIVFLNIQSLASIQSVFAKVQPQTIFDCSSFGAYSFENDFERIHNTNYMCFIRMMEYIADNPLHAYIHAGSSSEYGLNATAPAEDSQLIPNSHYAISKASVAHAITYYGKIRHLPLVNLRLYSVYGPYEDSSRLIPAICVKSLQNVLPPFANPSVSRDFMYSQDVVEAFVLAACHMNPSLYGESFNIGTGKETTLESLAYTAKEVFSIDAEPIFNAPVGRAWDTEQWYANPSKAARMLKFHARTSLQEGLRLTRDWWKESLCKNDIDSMTKKQYRMREKNSFSAIIACYKDAQAIPIMYERIVAVAHTLKMDYQIIFVNDASPDNSTEIINELSMRDANILGIVHSRNFGSQAAFRSGMELANKESVVLLDGDLQDPPELIEDFVRAWRDGADIVYGHRVKREMPMFLESCYKMFYRIFSSLSEIPIPTDAGDFSLIDRKAVYHLLQCKEKDFFLRGLRAYIGFKQVGIDYVRPERMFGVSTNNWIKNIGWAKKGIFSFTRIPLHLLTLFGGISCICTILLALHALIVRFSFPELAPRGLTFLSLLLMFFGSSILLGIGLLGEYIGKIFEETKSRPAFIRKSIIMRGEIAPYDGRMVKDNLSTKH